MKPLNYYARPITDESLASALLRTCNAHRVTPSEMFDAFGQNAALLPHELRNALMGKDTFFQHMLRLEDWKPHTSQVTLAKTRQFGRWIDYAHSKFCTECAKAGSLPFVHDFAVINVCTKHKRQLVDNCPHCSKRFTWNRLGLNQCRCGKRIKDSPYASADDIARADYLERLIHENKFDKISAYLLLELTLAERYGIQLSAGGISSYIEGNATELVVAMLEAAKYLPHLPTRALLAPLQCCGSDIITGNIGLIDLDSPIETECKSSANMEDFFLTREEVIAALGGKAEFADELTTYFNEQSPGETTNARLITGRALNTLYSHFRPTSPRSCGTSIREITTITKASRFELITRILEGDVHVTRFDPARSISDAEIDVKVEHIDEAPKGYLTSTQLETYLDSYGEAVRGLKNVGLLNAKHQKERNNRYLFSIDEVKSFHQDFALIGEIAAAANANPRRFSEKLMSAGVTPVSGPSIDEGVVYVFRRADLANKSLSAVENCESYETQCGRKPKTAERLDRSIWANATEAAAELGISVQQLKLFIGPDLLVSARPHNAPAGRTRYFRRDSIPRTGKHLREIVEIQQLALGLNVTSRQLNTRLKNLLNKAAIPFRDSHYVSKSDANALRSHFESYWDATRAASYLEVRKSDINNWRRLGYISAIQPASDGFLASPKLYRRENIVTFSASPDFIERLKRSTEKDINSAAEYNAEASDRL